MVLGRPAPFDGAFVDPKSRRFDRMRRTLRVEQPAILAASLSVGAFSPCNLLLIMLWISSCFESARFGAIVVKPLMEVSQRQRLCDPEVVWQLGLARVAVRLI